MICTCKIWQMKRLKVLKKTPRDPISPLMSEPEVGDQPGSHGPGVASGASSMPRTAQGKRSPPRPP